MTVATVVDAEVVRSADEWADVIWADLNRAVDGIVSAGRNLIKAKADLGPGGHGKWLPMLKHIGISERSAQELMSIGRNPAINARSCADLPTAARALYELSRLPAEDIEAGIDAGDITPHMTKGPAHRICLRWPGLSALLYRWMAAAWSAASSSAAATALASATEISVSPTPTARSRMLPLACCTP